LFEWLIIADPSRSCLRLGPQQERSDRRRLAGHLERRGGLEHEFVGDERG
jgi:hypothetical protein